MKKLICIFALVFPLNSFASPLSNQSQIIGGEPIGTDQAPWQLALYSRSGNHFCGAVLIEEDVLLTAAHCVWTSSPGSFSVRGGSANGSVSSLKRLPGVRDIVVHPEFRRKDFTAHDIAIVFLGRRIQATSTLQPVQIPDENFPFQVDEEFHQMDDFELMTSGWGMTSPPNRLPIPSKQLMAATLRPVASSNLSLYNEDIKAYLKERHDIGDSTLARIHSKNSRTLLADAPDKNAGTCAGDSGGPLVAEIDGENVLIGVSSYTAGGEKQCLGIGVFTNVQAYLPWIEEVLASR